MSENGNLADDWGAALSEQTGDSATDNNAYQPEQFNAPASEQAVAEARNDKNLELVLDIPVTLSMEIGRTRMPIRNLLQLSQGSVVELDRLAGEPMDVLVNGTLIAQGEVVVVNDKYGIRLTDVISTTERIKRLR